MAVSRHISILCNVRAISPVLFAASRYVINPGNIREWSSVALAAWNLVGPVRGEANRVGLSRYRSQDSRR